jgi:phage tail sheath gpL-like
MPVNFHQIPSNERVPLFYAEIDPSHANTGAATIRALMIGQMLAAGAAAADTPEISQGAADARTRYGQGSILAAMIDTYRKNDAFGEVWALPVADAGGATAATGSIAFSAATAAGVLSLYVAGVRVAVPVTSGQTGAQIATAVIAAITAAADLPVTAAVDGVDTTKVNLTARNKGLAGNDIDLRLNYLGSAAGEATPAGVAPVITAMAGGLTNPTLTTALANLGDEPFEVIAMPYTDATSIAALTAFLNDVAGRWSWQVQEFGHCVIANRGSYSGQTTFGTALNDQHASVIGFNDSPTPKWKWAAAVAAQAAVSVRADPAQPIRSVVLQDVLAPPLASRFSLSQRNSLLFDGISTFSVDPSGAVVLEKLITTYQKNAFGSPDDAYLDAETLFNLAFVLRQLKAVITSKYGRVKLAADGTALPAGTGVVTPSMIKADLIAKYRELEAGGFVQQSDVFAAALIVEQNATNPNRIDVLWPGVLIDRLDVFALLAQFRLN